MAEKARVRQACRLSTHANAPLTVEGRHRLVARCQTRPIAHVAREMGISRATASKWVNDTGASVRSGLSIGHPRPTGNPPRLAATWWRRSKRCAASTSGRPSRIAFELQREQALVSRRTVTRLLGQLGLNRRRFNDPSGESNRDPQKIVARRPGHMGHIDVKKAGRIPDGGGWRVHGRGSPEAKAADRTKKGTRAGYTYLHSAIDGHTRLAYTEALSDEKATTAVAFLNRARAWFAAHGIVKIERIVTDNGACYRSHAFAEALDGTQHRRTKPYTPKHNGKVERYNRILAEELLYARTWRSEQERVDALATWNVHYNYHRPHGAHDGQPPASTTQLRVNKVLASYS